MNMNEKFGKVANLLVGNLFNFEVSSHGGYIMVTVPLDFMKLQFKISDEEVIRIIERYPGELRSTGLEMDWNEFQDKLGPYLEYLVRMENVDDSLPMSDWVKWKLEESINLDSAYLKAKERIESEYSGRLITLSLLEEMEKKFNEYLEEYRSEIRVTSCNWNYRTNTVTVDVRM